MKKKIKTLLIWLSSVVHRDASPKVVFYHDIGQKYTPMGTPEPLFWSHMAYLQELKEESLHCPPPPTFSTSNAHVVAFDDGFRGIWDHRESMRLFDVHPIVFLAVGLVGQSGYLTWDEIRALQNDYGVNFQCHTWSHQTLTGPVNTDLPVPSDPNFRTDAWYHHELVDSKNELERQLNKKIDSLCFPVGYFSNEVIRRCTDAGYSNLYASFPGNKDDDNSTLQLQLETTTARLVPRILCQFSSLLEFKSILRGGLNSFGRRYLKMHKVDG